MAKTLDNEEADCPAVDSPDPGGGGGGGADPAATYWVTSASSGLSAEKVVGTSTGVVYNNAGTPQVIANGSNDLVFTMVAGVPAWAPTSSAITLSNSTPQNVGTATAGVAATASRADHVHALPDVVAGATIGYPASLTFDAKGRITSATTGTDPATLYTPLTRTLTAGAGLTGGGSLASDRTFNIAAADGTITVNADSIQVGALVAANIAGTTTNGFVVTLVAGVPTWAASATGASALGTYLVQTATNAPANAQIMASLATGIVKNTTTTGVQSIAVANTDYAHPSATYITQTATNAPAGAQVLGSLASGMLSVTTTTGVVASTAIPATYVPFGAAAGGILTTSSRFVYTEDTAAGATGGTQLVFTSSDSRTAYVRAFPASASGTTYGISNIAMSFFGATNNRIMLGNNASAIYIAPNSSVAMSWETNHNTHIFPTVSGGAITVNAGSGVKVVSIGTASTPPTTAAASATALFWAEATGFKARGQELATTTIGNFAASHVAANSGADVGFLVSNTSNTASSTATLEARVAGSSAGVAQVVLGRTGGTSYTLRATAASTLEILAGATTTLTVDNTYTLYGQGGSTSGGYVRMDNTNGSRLGYGTANAALTFSVDTAIVGRFRLSHVTTVTGAATTDLGNSGFTNVQGSATINYFTKTGLVSGNIYYVYSEAGQTITHNSGSPGGTAAAVLTRTGASLTVTAGSILAFMYSAINDKFVEVTGYGASGGVTAHSALTGLTSGDDHTQYALLAGRSGGQTLIGGTAASNNLVLTSTSHGTLGEVRVTDNFALFGAGSFGSGTKVMSMINASLAPGSAPTGGVIYWSESGVAKVVGTDGIAITL